MRVCIWNILQTIIMCPMCGSHFGFWVWETAKCESFNYDLKGHCSCFSPSLENSKNFRFGLQIETSISPASNRINVWVVSSPWSICQQKENKQKQKHCNSSACDQVHTTPLNETVCRNALEDHILSVCSADTVALRNLSMCIQTLPPQKIEYHGKGGVV